VAYIFIRTTNSWRQSKKIAADDGSTDDRFGSSVDISGSNIIVGANWDDYDANGDGSLEQSVGSAYIFGRNQGGTNNWGQIKKLTINSSSSSQFGLSVAITGDIAIVTAPFYGLGIADVFSCNQGVQIIGDN
jgi:hypothetical protein